MKSLPLVSILIPTYNREKLVQRAINSALNQTYPNIEVIVSDNCSTDGTIETLRVLYGNSSRVKVFENSSNTGPVSNWVNCIKKSKGEYSKLLFSDDEISTNYIEETINILIENEEVGFVYTPVIIEKTDSKKRVFYQTYSGSKMIESCRIQDRFLLDINVPVSPGAALFRKADLLNSIKLFIKNPKKKDFNVYGAGTDLNIYFESLKRYKFIYYSNKTMAYFHGHDTSFTINNNLDYYYKTVRLNFLKEMKFSIKRSIIYMLIKLKFTKVFNFCSPYFNRF